MFTPYASTRPLRSLLAENPKLITTLSRFGIPLGFGDRTVEQVCTEAGVDTHTFLAVVNLLTGRKTHHNPEKLSLSQLLAYLRNSHDYFLQFVLPRVRRDLIEAISSDAQGEVSMMILKFYDDFVEEVTRHMEQEERNTFAPIDALLAGHTGVSIEGFDDVHHPMYDRLRELKEIFVCHYHAETPRTDLLNSVLLDIITCERDIADHGIVEEHLLLPALHDLEYSLASDPSDEPGEPEKTTQELTGREKDIVVAIAHGQGNKQIADRLCVSVHTVTTHRRNICAKLDIHSPAGLTIYALIHGLVDITSIKP